LCKILRALQESLLEFYNYLSYYVFFGYRGKREIESIKRPKTINSELIEGILTARILISKQAQNTISLANNE